MQSVEKRLVSTTIPNVIPAKAGIQRKSTLAMLDHRPLPSLGTGFAGMASPFFSGLLDDNVDNDSEPILRLRKTFTVVRLGV